MVEPWRHGLQEEVIGGFKQGIVPEVVDKLTPEGRLPTEQEAARMV